MYKRQAKEIVGVVGDDTYSSGLELTVASGETLTDKEVGVADVTYSGTAATGSIIQLPVASPNKNYEMRVLTATGNTDDKFNLYVFPKTTFSGANIMSTDNETPTVELAGRVLAPDNGRYFGTRHVVSL